MGNFTLWAIEKFDALETECQKVTFEGGPHSPWQKGGVENFNGRIRRFLPKSFDHKNLTQDLVNKIENIMNNQPRKCLEFRTPAEVFYNDWIVDFVALET
jgi:IS30 family transposase